MHAHSIPDDGPFITHPSGRHEAPHPSRAWLWIAIAAVILAAYGFGILTAYLLHLGAVHVTHAAIVHPLVPAHHPLPSGAASKASAAAGEALRKAALAHAHQQHVAHLHHLLHLAHERYEGFSTGGY